MYKQSGTDRDTIDLCGIGIGPSNLSLAALLYHKVKYIDFEFFDARKELSWHSGMLFPDANLQNSFLKDLVTLVDPSNPYSFLCFLAERGRLYRFLTARFSSVKRKEFDQYLRWVSQSIPHLNFNQKVEDIEFNDVKQQFIVHTSEKTIATSHLALGTGLTPKVPDCARPHLGDDVFHSIHYLQKKIQFAGKRVTVIGGGQSGAEIVSELLSNSHALPKQVYWISSRRNFLPIDDSPFTNEYFVPRYSDYFYGLPQQVQKTLVAEQTLASDGITESLLSSIYQRLYQLEFLEQSPNIAKLIPNARLWELRRDYNSWHLIVRSQLESVQLNADVIILATGFEYRIPDYLKSLSHRLEWREGQPVINPDFSVKWDGSDSNRIYTQNCSRLQRGVADPNLSLMAWRSAIIVNSLVGRMVYPRSQYDGLIDWELQSDHAHQTLAYEIIERLSA
ncbi:lysine N(6)-hydroxylase/L-ornithine N(5)-oxygenase family protein [Sphaerospermopsis sp. LEGE 08334]|uniref:lysine N(6)-hydroxylase/L-ornithine N(5)-oxygenase family protein n=1 Tax=Sphaerospermopsis sp. LEGE 08334 TaxID=1828651 RepID=UPI001881DA82|nr:SidA/IucD/PvdA family monooxygenase [Sphaerospermopsis sp. LEGE 08334]MBE9057975.1 SidA/IucD/PvdA family monooxygenase [Sphaerospermopsis sp. LEGE 08334]